MESEFRESKEERWVEREKIRWVDKVVGEGKEQEKEARGKNAEEEEEEEEEKEKEKERRSELGRRGDGEGADRVGAVNHRPPNLGGGFFGF
jgi:hypothetical protein